MKKKDSQKKIGRVIDANVNRVAEGLRVMEEIVRFLLDDKKLTAQLKELRAQVRRVGHGLAERDIKGDVGRHSYTEKERQRKDLAALFLANAKRVEEGLRVLEEFFKLMGEKSGQECKRWRFQVYEIEQRVVEKIKPLP